MHHYSVINGIVYTHTFPVILQRLYETTQICACMIHVIMMLYDIIMWHRRMIHEGFMMQAVNDVVWCEHLVWIQYAACMYVVCMCLNDNVMSFFSVWCTRRMRRKSLYECCMKSYDVNMNVWRFREEMTEFREEMSRLPFAYIHTCTCRRYCRCSNGHTLALVNEGMWCVWCGGYTTRWGGVLV